MKDNDARDLVIAGTVTTLAVVGVGVWSFFAIKSEVDESLDQLGDFFGGVFGDALSPENDA